MENYSNSLSSRTPVGKDVTGFPDIPKKEEKEVKKEIKMITEAPAIVKKKSGLRRFRDDFIESEVADVKESIFMDIIMPAIKNTIADGISTFVDMMLFGDSSRSRIGSTRSGAKRITSYNSIYDSNPRNKVQTRKVRIGSEIDDIILGSRVDAERVVASLADDCEEYGMVSVADLYYRVGHQSSYTDNKYGWTDISGYSITRVREGFLLRLPDPKPLDI